jgi:hypothetical protein
MNAIEWGHRLLVRRMHRQRTVGRGRPGERHVPHQHGSNKDPNNSGVHFPFVSAWEKNNGTTNFTLKYGNANSGGLTTPFSGPLPNGYSPMKLQSSILLGTGGDNSVSGVGCSSRVR